MLISCFYSIYQSEFEDGFFQFLCALTLPIARLVVSYVEENHNVSTKLV